jgi:hypothetical protein
MKIKVLTLLLALAIGLQAQAEEKPEAQVSFKVVDDTGKPLPGIEVRMVTFIRPGSGKQFGSDITDGPSGKTDDKGMATLTYPSQTGRFRYGINQTPGYYYHRGDEQLFTTSKDGKWQPWNPTVELIFKPILNTVPMYARRIRSMPIPEDGKPIGFDLIESDWVAPYGKGKTADFIFKIERQYESVEKPFDATLTVTFLNDGDGIQPIYAKPYVGSVLRLPRQAPEDGYEPKLIKKIFRDAGQPIVSDTREDQNYFFRVRTEKKNGKIVSAMYGKTWGDIEFWGNGKIGFTYYLNPDGTRNMEFDPKQNLFKNLESTKRPTEP